MPSATVPASRGRSRRSPGSRRPSGAVRTQRALGLLLRSGRLPALCVALGMLVLLYGFLYSGDFLIASVEVRGTDLGDPAEVVLVANAIGQSIFRIDPGNAADRVASLAYVEHVTVETRFPDRVVVTVTERSPVLLWKSGTQHYLVDRRGNVIGPSQSSSLPAVVVEGDPPVRGSMLDERVVAAVLAIQSALGERLDRLELTGFEGLVASLTNGDVVIFGDASDIPLKLSIFTEVEPQGGDWSLLDLREPDRPYYK